MDSGHASASMPIYAPSNRIWMRSTPAYNERWLQRVIAENPSLLGLGELHVKDIERNQPRAGRLDMLLADPETSTRYEVELRLGATDESHIIRTIEYWDLERRRYPQYEHVAVIVAEEITARFFNVVSLFNGFIPIVAIQASLIQVENHATLVFTTILDQMALAVEEDDPSADPADRAYWERRASPETLALTDQLLAVVREVEPRAALNYNRNYIGLAVDGVSNNFVGFRPRRERLIVNFKIARSAELDARLEDSGLTLLTYRSRHRQYSVSLAEADLSEHADLLRELVKVAHDSYGR
jgi:hypothetical protein